MIHHLHTHVRVGTGPAGPAGAGPDRLKWLDRPVFAGFYRFKEISRFTCTPPQDLVKNEFYNFFGYNFIPGKICSGQVSAVLFK